MGIARAVGRETVLVKALVRSYSLFTCQATIGAGLQPAHARHPVNARADAGRLKNETPRNFKKNRPIEIGSHRRARGAERRLLRPQLTLALALRGRNCRANSRPRYRATSIFPFSFFFQFARRSKARTITADYLSITIMKGLIEGHRGSDARTMLPCLYRS